MDVQLSVEPVSSIGLEFGSEFITTATSENEVVYNVFVNFGETPTVQGKFYKQCELSLQEKGERYLVFYN